VVNIVTLILGFLAVVAAAIWFTFFSSYQWFVRLGVATGVPLLAALGLYLFPLDHVNGTLVPSFRFRWSPKPDERLARERPAAGREGATVDLAQTTADDFPQFLGPERSAWIEGNLGRDWKSDTPKTLWRQPIGAGWSAFSAASGFAVTLEQRGPDEMVTCYEVRSGKLVWSHAIQARHYHIMGGTGPRSTPTIHEGKVYALGATGLLHCLDGATGEPAWPSIDLLELCGSTVGADGQRVMWGRSASPLIVDDVVVVPLGGPPTGPWKSLIAFDKNTGQERWRGGDRQVGYSSPVLATLCGVRQIVSVNEDNVSGHDPNTGKVLWSEDWPGRSFAEANASQAVPVGPDRFFLSKAYGGGAALVKLELDAGGRWTTDRQWHVKNVLKTKFTNVVVKGNAIYGLSDGILECVDLEAGQRNWKGGRYGQGQILGVGDLLLVQAESGEVVLCELNPSKHVELARFPAIQGVTWNNLCLFGRLLLVRNAEEAACYELPVSAVGNRR
jgi:outer membrane protein assembly factor BamB